GPLDRRSHNPRRIYGLCRDPRSPPVSTGCDVPHVGHGLGVGVISGKPESPWVFPCDRPKLIWNRNRPSSLPANAPLRLVGRAPGLRIRRGGNQSLGTFRRLVRSSWPAAPVHRCHVMANCPMGRPRKALNRDVVGPCSPHKFISSILFLNNKFFGVSP